MSDQNERFQEGVDAPLPSVGAPRDEQDLLPTQERIVAEYERHYASNPHTDSEDVCFGFDAGATFVIEWVKRRLAERCICAGGSAGRVDITGSCPVHAAADRAAQAKKPSDDILVRLRHFIGHHSDGIPDELGEECVAEIERLRGLWDLDRTARDHYMAKCRRMESDAPPESRALVEALRDHEQSMERFIRVAQDTGSQFEFAGNRAIEAASRMERAASDNANAALMMERAARL